MASLANNSLQRLKSNSLCRACQGMMSQVIYTRGHRDDYRHHTSWKALKLHSQICSTCRFIASIEESFPTRTFGPLKDHSVYVSICSHIWDSPSSLMYIKYRGGERCLENKVMCVKTLEGDVAEKSGITPIREVLSTSSKRSLQVALEWIRECIMHHKCGENLEPWGDSREWPRRLIDVIAFKDSLDARLIDVTPETFPSRPKYTTLSYCWGHDKSSQSLYVTTLITLEACKQRISYSTLPATIRDAVCITRGLGIQYLWVDAICILQNSEEWQLEAAKMASIYSSSYVTISADSAVDTSVGCFNRESTGQFHQLKDVIEVATNFGGGQTSYVYFHRDQSSLEPQEIDTGPLHRRAWTLQERIFSARILHYTGAQLIWECRHGLRTEDNIHHSSYASKTLVSKLAKLTAESSGHGRLLYLWYHDVIGDNYSGRKLTVPEDKLSAISSLARFFHSRMPDKAAYLAGIWAHKIQDGLAWQRAGSASRPSTYICPSWSWASIDTAVEWDVQMSSLLLNEGTIGIEEAFILPESEDHFGRISAGWLRVSGRLRVACIQRPENGSLLGLRSDLVDLEGNRLGFAVLDDDICSLDSLEFNCLRLIEQRRPHAKRCTVLLLQPSPSQPEAYERRGVALIDEMKWLPDESSWFDECATQRIKII